MTEISGEAAAEIDARKTASRQPVLDDLCKVVRDREGGITNRQMGIVADILSYLVSPADLGEALETWLTASGVGRDQARLFFESPEWGDVVSRSAESAHGLVRAYHAPGAVGGRWVDPRKDWAIRTIMRVFLIEEEESTRLGLTKLVSNRLRKAAARRAEGARVGRPGRPSRQDRPTIDQTVSVRTLQRREKAALESALAEKIEAVKKLSRNSALSGSSFLITNDMAEFRDTAISGAAILVVGNDDMAEFRDTAISGGFPEVERQPQPPAKADIGQPSPTVLSTAEARRLAAVVQRLGGRFSSGAHHRYPETWWEFPPGSELSRAQRAEFDAALLAARRGEWRRAALAQAEREAKKKVTTFAEWWDSPVTHHNHCPGRVSPELWSHVSKRHRAEVWRWTASLFMSGWGANDAVVEAVTRVVRSEALVMLILAVRPDLQGAAISELARSKWWLATEDASRQIVSMLDTGDPFPR